MNLHFKKMNRKFKIFYSVALLALSMNCYADTDFPVSLLSEQINITFELGKTSVEGMAEVSLVARRNGNQLVVHAQDTDGKTIGKAETVVGLKETPIFVTTPRGLRKITIHWGVNKP